MNSSWLLLETQPLRYQSFLFKFDLKLKYLNIYYSQASVLYRVRVNGYIRVEIFTPWIFSHTAHPHMVTQPLVLKNKIPLIGINTNLSSA